MAINIAIVLGVGVFIVPSEVAKNLSSPNMIMLAWLVGGLISLLGALCYAELSSSFPKTGGSYIYLKESYGPMTGFLFGWTELLVIRTGSIAAVSFIFAEYLQSFLSIKENSLLKPIAITTVVIFSIINIAGLRYGKRVQNLSVVARILAIVMIVFLGLISGKGSMMNLHSGHLSSGKGILPLFGLALIPILWTYGGWHENTFVAEETMDAKKVIPFALIAGIFIITGLYLLINFFYLYLMTPDLIKGPGLVASKALEILWGDKGKKLLEAMVIVSSLGCLNAMLLTGSRVTYAMAKDNAIFKYIGTVNPASGMPVRAIIINSVWAIVLIWLGTFNMLLFFTGIMVWVFFALTAGSVFILRHKFPKIERPYKVWGYPIVPAVFILICLALSINSMVHYPFQSLIGLCFAMTGIPLFFMTQGKPIRKDVPIEITKDIV